MCARSQASGLMISTCWRSTSSSDSGLTSASVRSRPSARASVRGWGGAISFEITERVLRACFAFSVVERPDRMTTSPSTVAVRNIADWRGKDVLDATGSKLGKFEDLYYHGDTDPPM